MLIVGLCLPNGAKAWGDQRSLSCSRIQVSKDG